MKIKKLNESVEPQPNGYHNIWTITDNILVHNDGGVYHVVEKQDDINKYIFTTENLEELNNYLSTNYGETIVDPEPKEKPVEKPKKRYPLYMWKAIEDAVAGMSNIPNEHKESFISLVGDRATTKRIPRVGWKSALLPAKLRAKYGERANYNHLIISPEYYNTTLEQALTDIYDTMKTKWFNESLSEGIEIETIADYITDHYKFETIDDKYSCIDSIRNSFKDEKTISKEELEQFIGAHNGKDKIEEDFGFKSGDKYLGGLPSEPSSLEYGKAINKAYLDSDKFKEEKQHIIDFAEACKLDGSPCEDYHEFAKVLADDGIVATNTLWNIYLDTLNESKSIEESKATHCVYFSMDGGKTQEIEFEGTEDECYDYIEKQEADNEFGDEAPERFIKRLHESKSTHCVYFTQDNIDQIEFEGTEDECNKYISDIQAEQDDEFGDESPERFIKKLDEAKTLTESNIKHIYYHDDPSGLKKGQWLDVKEENGRTFAKWSFNDKWYDITDEIEELPYHRFHNAEKAKTFTFGGWRFWLDDEVEKFWDIEGNRIIGDFEIPGMPHVKRDVKEPITESLSPREGDRVQMDFYAKDNNGATGTCTGRIGELCFIEWDDGTKSKEIKGYLKVIERPNMNEASYGGAFDIADDQIFTREDIDNLAEEVLNHINETYEYKFDISAAYIDGNELEVGVENDELGEYMTTLKIDMRKVKEPWHLKRVYAFEVASDLINQISRSLNGLGESLTESNTEGAKPIETGAALGMATVLSDLIKDEYEAIDGYNTAIATAEAEGFGDMVKVLTDIQAEENIHIGQLQELMKMVDPNASKIEDGTVEAEELLSNPSVNDDDDFDFEGIDESFDVSKDDIADEDVDAAIKAVEEAMKEPNKEEIDLTNANFDLEDDDEVIVESTEPWEDIYNSFKDIEVQLNGDGEAITATIDRIYNDNKDNPDFEKAYKKWAANE